MSLFGTSPDDASTRPTKSNSSLFSDAPSAAASQQSSAAAKSSLFADDNVDADSSPWDMPTPRKSRRSRVEIVRKLLVGAEVPSLYVDAFDSLHDTDGAGASVSSAGVAKVLKAAKLGSDNADRIVDLMRGEDGSMGDLERSSFHVFLALIGLAQAADDVTLDGVDERRKNLPIPTLHGLDISNQEDLPKDSTSAPKSPQRPSTPPNPEHSDLAHKDSFGIHDADPWGSPDMHREHQHESHPVRPNGVDALESISNKKAPARTTSDFSTQGMRDSMSNLSRSDMPTTPAAGVWESYEENPSSKPNNTAIDHAVDEEYNTPVRGRPVPNRQSRTTSNLRPMDNGIEENIIVMLLPEKEGIFMFQHHNYQVTSVRRGSKVVRRYSDFVWLLDCLHKRYPFRQLPLLPPKRVAVNGKHLAADSTFIEKRRRGLVRFANALVRHPVIGQEQLVTMFLTVPTELAVWRKQANLSISEEFVGKELPPGLEDSLSPTLIDLFDATRTGVTRSAGIYINLCNLLDRLGKRTEGLAADHLRLTLLLQALTDVSQDTYASDTNEVPLLNEGLQATAKHVSNCQTLLEDEAKAWDEGVLEDLKKQRDALVSLRDMFERRERYDKDNIPQLEHRIQGNENKLMNIRNKPEGAKPGEVEKVTEAIIKDKQSIVAQHARGVFAKECIRDELLYFQSTQRAVSKLHQNWAQERVKYSELQADNWKQLLDQLEAMPMGD